MNYEYCGKIMGRINVKHINIEKEDVPPIYLSGMVFIGELFEAGKVVPVIDRRYPLSKVAEALWYLEEGHH